MNQEDIIKVLRKNNTFLDKEDFEQLYKRFYFYASLGTDIRDFTLFFQQNGVDPLSYMREVPGYYLFHDKNLNEIDIPEGIERIGEAAFYGCENLQSIHIPVSVSRICEFAFYQCVNLHAIAYEGTIEQWRAVDKDRKWNLGSYIFKIQCSDGNIEEEQP